MKEPRYQQLLQTHVLTYHANLNKLDAVEIEACNEPFVTKWYFERHWPFQFDFGIAKGLSSIWLLFLHFGGDKISSHPHDARESTCQDVSLINRQVQRERKSIKVNSICATVSVVNSVCYLRSVLRCIRLNNLWMITSLDLVCVWKVYGRTFC